MRLEICAAGPELVESWQEESLYPFWAIRQLDREMDMDMEATQQFEKTINNNPSAQRLHFDRSDRITDIPSM